MSPTMTKPKGGNTLRDHVNTILIHKDKYSKEEHKEIWHWIKLTTRRQANKYMHII